MAVGDEAHLADVPEFAAREHDERTVNDAERKRNGQSQNRIDQKQQTDDKQGDNDFRDQLHTGNDDADNHLLHFGQQARTEVRGVAAQKKGVGLADIADQQASRERVAAHITEAGEMIGGQRGKGVTDRQDNERATSQKDKKLVWSAEPEGVVRQGQPAVFLNRAGITYERQKRSDRRDTENLEKTRGDYGGKEQIEGAALRR